MAENKFKIGAAVHVKKLGKDGVLKEITSKGLYRVVCGVMTLELKPQDVGPSKPDKYQGMAKKLKKQPISIEGAIATEKFKDDLDLHGLRVEEALAKVSHYIDQAILADAPQVRLLHGLGTGKLLDAIHKYLKKTAVVKHFNLDPNNPGVTIAYF